MNKIITHGVVAGVLSSVACTIYFYLYQYLLFLDFGVILSIGSISGACLLACLLMAGGYLLSHKINKPKLEGVLNIFYIIIAFVSIIIPITITLPLDVDFPELFPGLAVPMHFIPPTIFFGIMPFFRQPL